MTGRALDGDGVAGSVRTMAHSPSATETIIEQVPGGISREGDSGLGVEGFGGCDD